MIFCHSQIEAVGDLTQSLPLSLKGEGLGIAFLGFVGFALLVHSWITLAQQGRSGASLVSRFPTLSPKPHTGPHRAEFGFPVFVCLRCARKHILASVFLNRFCESLFFVYCPANFAVAPPPFLGKQKAGISSSLCKNIYSSTTFWLNRIKMLAACALVVVPAGSKALSS